MFQSPATVDINQIRGLYQIKKGVIQVPDNEILIKIIQDNFNHLREDMNQKLNRIDNKFDSIEDKLDELITVEDCKKNRKFCIENLQLKRSEMSIKTITAIGGVVTGTIAASSAIVIAILKIFFPI
jgi:low affinity Fe/Cu permease